MKKDLEKTEEKMVAAVSKLDKAGTAADDSERTKKVFQSKAAEEDSDHPAGEGPEGGKGEG